ncbi:MAG: peptidoglycan DD-metalloendopeptidase family protein [Betaproteobacteria bacterium]|nr:peptidoglycan DD-metalloendopeptidase family protein [Betaproteobacteria bacterium]
MTAPRPAPVIERLPQAKPVTAPKTAAKPQPRPPDRRPEFYTVRKGDTLYSIALDHGLDYKDLAEWNGLGDPNAIKAGQQLRLIPPATATAVVSPIKPLPPVESRPVAAGDGPVPAAGGDAPRTQPRGVKLPYSDQAFAQMSGQAAAKTEPARVAKADPRPESAPAVDDDNIDWGWPAIGKVISTFSEGANLKGVSIGGKLGQPVLASAAGRVVYSGSGLRGYGKLVIIKHNKTFLSVYAHNSELVVKEGQNVVKGQKIAEMGNTDTDRVKLHFEIRRFGKPVDPIRLLPGSGPA